MNEHRAVWTTLAELLHRLERDITAALPAEPSPNGLAELEKEVHKLGKTQFKANTLAAEQAGQLEKTLALLTAQQQQQTALVEQLATERIAAAHQEWLASLLPVLDGLDHAIGSGEQYLWRRDLAATASHFTPAQTVLVSPADRAVLAGWLEGLTLMRERLLKLLETQGVAPIPTVGRPFDPYLHVAVATAVKGAVEPGTIVAEERRGYRTTAAVLRFAEVVVYKPASTRVIPPYMENQNYES